MEVVPLYHRRSAWMRWTLPLLIALGVGGCSGPSVPSPFNREVIVQLGEPRVVPAEVAVAAEAISGTYTVSVEVPYRFTSEQTDVKANLTLRLVDGLPAGLSLGGAVKRDDVADGDAQLETFSLQLSISSTGAIGTVSPGRHTVRLEAGLCATGVVDASPGTGSTICDTRMTTLVVVIGGAAAPSAPTGLAATPRQTEVQLRWNADPAPDSYLLERALTGAAFTAIATLTAPITQHADTGLTPATAYTYRLTPRNTAGTGPAATIDVQTLAETGNGLVAAAVTGGGVGRVSSAPSAIDCPGTCTGTFPLGSNVTLSAAPAVGSVFDGWSGPADCADGVITVVAEIACTATFSPAPSGTRGWTFIGELLPSAGEAPLIAPQRSSDLHVALRRVNSTNGFRELLVMRRSGAQTWALLPGGAPNGIANATSHGFVVDPSGRPMIAWTEASAVRVARFDNGTWTRIADNLRIGSGTPAQLQFEWRGAQPPVVSWLEIDGGIHRLAVKRLTGDLALADGPWVGGFLPDIANLRGHRMALDSNGLPSFVVSRLNVSLQEPLAAWRVTAMADGSVQAEALGGDITVATGIAYQHDQQGYGIGFSLNFDGSSGATLVMGTRDTRYAYAKAFNSVSWVQGGRRNGVLDPDGIVLDTASGSGGEFVLGAATMRTPGIALMLAVGTVSSQLPDRIELISLDGLDWITPTEPLSVPQLHAIGSGILDSNDRPTVLTVENFGAGGRGRIHAYQWIN